MRKKMLFLYNPISGKGLVKSRLSEILDIFTRAGYDVTVRPTQGRGDAAEYARLYADHEETDCIVCSGGDGTLDEVVTGVMNAERRDIPVGYIPSGSTNDFAGSIGIPTNLTEAASRIADGKVFPCDVGQFNDDCFIYVAAFGMFTDVSYGTDQNLKNALGHAAYLIEASKKLFDMPHHHMRIEAEGKVIEGNFTYGMITNAKSVGGIKGITGGGIDLSDGVFEVTLVRQPVQLADLSEILTTLVTEDASSEMVIRFKSGHIVIESQEEIAWTLDGEYGGTHSRVVICNRHRELQLLFHE